VVATWRMHIRGFSGIATIGCATLVAPQAVKRGLNRW
jgi:hypothetical protein